MVVDDNDKRDPGASQAEAAIAAPGIVATINRATRIEKIFCFINLILH